MKHSQSPKLKDLRNFSLIWFLIFLVMSIYPMFKGLEPRNWSIGISLSFLFIAVLKPEVLRSFYIIWVKVGEFIGGIVSKVIMFVLYFGVFTLISLILKILGKDLLKKRLDNKATTYWITREMQPQSMKNQF